MCLWLLGSFLAPRPTASWQRPLSNHPDERMARAKLLYRQIAEKRGAGDLPEAIRLAEEGLTLRRSIYGETHEAIAHALNLLAGLYGESGDVARAVELGAQSVSTLTARFGPDHPRTAIGLINLGAWSCELGQPDRAGQLYTRGIKILRPVRRHLPVEYARAIYNLASLEEQRGQYKTAAELLEEALELLDELGIEPPILGSVLERLGRATGMFGFYRRAEELLERSLEFRRSRLPGGHPQIASSLDNLAALYRRVGDYSRAEDLYRRSLAILDQHPAVSLDRLQVLGNLGVLLLELNRLHEAEPLLREVVESRSQRPDSAPVDTALALTNLAALYLATGDLSRAEPLFARALRIQRAALPADHPELAQSLSNLGLLYSNMGEDERALPLLLESQRLSTKAFGADHPHTAAAVHNRALALGRLGQTEKAEALFRRSLEIRRRRLGVDHPETSPCLNSLALLHASRGELEKAEALWWESVRVLSAAFGAQNHQIAFNLDNLAVLAAKRGDHLEAERLARQAMKIIRAHLDRNFAVQSERQQLLMTRSFRERLDVWLSMALRAGVPAEEIYRGVLPWKGAVAAVQSRSRLRSTDAAATKAASQLRALDQELAKHTLAGLSAEADRAWKSRLGLLTERKENLERELALAASRRATEPAAPTLEELQRRLPGRSVLIDFLEYSRVELDGPRRVLAFVLWPDRAPAVVDMGLLEPLSSEIGRWVESLARSRGRLEDVVPRRLGRLFWERLGPHLEGAIQLFVAPDGVLGRVPWAALPGLEPGSYLLHDFVISLIPFPQLLPELAESSITEARARESASLLAIGAVGYGAPARETSRGDSEATRPGPRTAMAFDFSPLPHTSEEIRTIRRLFERRYSEGRVEILEAAEATETAFRRRAGSHRWLHLATHGFFAPESLSDLLSSIPDPLGRATPPNPLDFGSAHPGLLGGLAMAGANRTAADGPDDGVLTALEVAGLDLGGVEMVVLSACETALGGDTVGGEGLLGLQRAFQVAGARSVVGTLWRIPDRETRRFMEKFYDLLWDQNLPKAEALRTAQLWMLERSAGGDEDGSQRGAEPIPEPSLATPASVAPYYWAGFVLSGSWH